MGGTYNRDAKPQKRHSPRRGKKNWWEYDAGKILSVDH
jgi:hypothetical protein